VADRPTYDEFCVARHLANTRDDDLGKFAYQVCRWYRGSMFIRQEAEIALKHIRSVASRPDGVVISDRTEG
jgi:hypothetical protein